MGVGGSRRHVSAFLAQKFPDLHFVVQDISSETTKVKHFRLPEDGKKRVKIMKHDFFKPQSVRGVDVYLFRIGIYIGVDYIS